MTALREEFEAWFSDGLPAPLKRNGEGYVFMAAQSAWDAWQAAHLAGQRAMQERAAIRAESEPRVWGDAPDPQHRIATGIRAMGVKP